MGAWPEPVLAYGYFLGGKQSGWSINPIKDDSWRFSPYDLDWFEGDADDFIDEAENRLSKELIVGAPQFITIGTEGGLDKILGFEHQAVQDGALVLPSLADTITWDLSLIAALEILGITPEQDRPYWLHEAVYY